MRHILTLTTLFLLSTLACSGCEAEPTEAKPGIQYTVGTVTEIQEDYVVSVVDLDGQGEILVERPRVEEVKVGDHVRWRPYSTHGDTFLADSRIIFRVISNEEFQGLKDLHQLQ